MDGRRVRLGRYGTTESRRRYHQILAEWNAGGRRRRPTDRHDITITEVLAQFWKHAESYYRRDDGTLTHEIAGYRTTLRPLKELYGATKAVEFGPKRLRAVRQRTIDNNVSRRTINQRIGRIKRVFKWAASEELVPVTVYQSLQTVPGLKRGRTKARETEPVRPVPDEYVDAIRPHVSRQVWAIVEMQRLTGMRSGEVVIMRGCDLDTTGKLWLYRPARHKTQHRDHERIVEIGPRGQKVIQPFLKADLEAFLFSPAEAEAERRKQLHAKRKTPLSCGNRPGTNRTQKPLRCPGLRYDPNSYRRAVQAAREAAGVPPVAPTPTQAQLRHDDP